jgi:hypothetical protein
MPRRSLRPELNRIRAWVRQGRTDAWIAHQLEVTVQQIQAFKREQALTPDAEGDNPLALADYDDEIDLRAEDEALVAAELEAEAQAAAEAAEAEAAAKAAAEAEAAAAAEAARAERDKEPDEGEEERRGRRRSRRGGRARPKRKPGTPLEGTFDHGEEGYGLWLDPAVQDDPVYAEYWAGHRPIEVTIEEDQIVIRRSGGEDDGEEDE